MCDIIHPASISIAEGLFPEQLANLRPDVPAAHQTFADEDRADTDLGELPDVGKRVDAAFAHEHLLVCHQIGHSQRMAEISFKRAQVPIVNAEERVAAMGEADDAV